MTPHSYREIRKSASAAFGRNPQNGLTQRHQDTKRSDAEMSPRLCGFVAPCETQIQNQAQSPAFGEGASRTRRAGSALASAWFDWGPDSGTMILSISQISPNRSMTAIGIMT